jgi:hypothetical protein
MFVKNRLAFSFRTLAITCTHPRQAEATIQESGKRFTFFS